MKTNKLSEQIHILQAQQGDVDAFEKLIGLYHNRLLFYARKMLRDEELANDVMQTVWLKAFRNIHTLRHPEAFSVWIYRIVRNYAVEQIRDEQKDKALNQEVLEEWTSVSEEHQEEFMQFDPNRVNQALNQLHSIFREVLVLRFMEDMSYEEIAGVTKVNIGTVRSRLHNAKKKLKLILEEMQNEC